MPKVRAVKGERHAKSKGGEEGAPSKVRMVRRSAMPNFCGTGNAEGGGCGVGDDGVGHTNTSPLPQTWLKPGGKLLITDYCCGELPWSASFEEYVRQRGYILYTVPRYGKLLEEAGFVRVLAQDRTKQFLDVLEVELRDLEENKTAFLQDFAEDDYCYIVRGWQAKMSRCEAGDQRWGLFYAEKPGDGEGSPPPGAGERISA
ncbi:uncharacterized protein [Mobula birostris]|uniref:uncharacterized protein n=1 Tax=Mobula birostris TaxID=1983395 RepID=UPI003B28AB9C